MSRRRVTAPRCKICASPHRAEIEFAHCSGIGLDSIAGKFAVPRMSVWRHCRNHLKADERAAYLADVDIRGLADRAHGESMAVMDYLVIVRATLIRQFQLAAGMGDRHATATLAGKLTELLKLNATITGDLARLAPTSTTNIAVFTQSPMFADLAAMLVRSLASHPEALAKVLEGLDEMEAKAAPQALTAPMIDGNALEVADAAAA